MTRTSDIRAGRAYVELSLHNRIGKGLKVAERQLASFAAATARVGAAISGLGTAGLAAFLPGVKEAAAWEQAEVAFSTLLGSAEKAQRVLRDLNQFAEVTPFELSGLIEAAKQFVAFGFSADELIPTMRRLGDVSAGLGIPINDLAYLYGTARVQGRLFMQDINQLTNRGIPVITELAKQFGVAESAVRELVSSGRVTFANLEEAFRSLTSEGGRFAGLMEKQSLTAIGRWSTFRDVISSISRTIGQSLEPITKKLLDHLIAVSEAVNKWIKDNKQIVTISAMVAGGLVAVGSAMIGVAALIWGASLAIGKLTVVAGLAASAIAGIGTVAAALTTPLGLAAAAAATLGVTLIHATGAGASAIRWLGRVFADLHERVIEVVDAIGAALSAGDVALAAKVLWLALKLEWQRGKQALVQVWVGFKEMFLGVATDAFFGAARIAADVVASIKTVWTGLKGFFQTFWADLKNQFAETFHLAELMGTKAANNIRGAFDEAFDAAGANRQAEDTFVGKQLAAQRTLRADESRIERQRQDDHDRIGRDYRDIQIGLSQMEAEANNRRRGAHEAELEASVSALAQARREYHQAIQETREAGGKALSEMPSDALDPGAIQKQISGLLGEASTARGTFNPFAIQRAFGGQKDDEKRRTRAAEEHTRLLRDIAQLLSEGYQVQAI